MSHVLQSNAQRLRIRRPVESTVVARKVPRIAVVFDGLGAALTDFLQPR
ncbi:MULTISPECIES: hypothetical protein [unclassified Pseudomonas]|nr:MULTISPECIES: hypothetical protein [unclassified Pseudomonas]